MNPLRQTNRRGTLLAFPIQTPSSHDALLVVDLSNPSYRSLGRFIRTGSTLVAAPELHPGAGCHYRHHRLAQVKGTQRPVGPSSPHRPFAVSPFRFWLLAPSTSHLPRLIPPLTIAPSEDPEFRSTASLLGMVPEAEALLLSS
jgi:hypothetical protein